MADPKAGVRVRCRLLALDRRQQVREVERRRADRRRVAQVAPVLARLIGGELDPVAVGVGQVDRLRDPVIGGSLDRRAGVGQALDRAGQLLPRGMEQGEVVEAGVASGRLERPAARGGRAGLRRRLRALPVPLAGAQPQADRALVELDRAVEVGDDDVDGPRRRSSGSVGAAAVCSEWLLIQLFCQTTQVQSKTTAWRTASPLASRSKPSLISSSASRWVSSRSTGSRPSRCRAR